MSTEVLITSRDFEFLQSHLFAGPQGREQLAYLLAGVALADGALRLLVREVIPVPPEGFEQQSAVYLRVKREFTRDVYLRCLKTGLSLIESHSHPFIERSVSFSRTDVKNELEKFTWVERKIPHIYNATLVFGQESVDGHIWDKASHTIAPIHEVKVVGSPQRKWVTTSGGRGVSEPDGITPPADELRFSRQILAFGGEGQRALASCHVGILGAGGIGWIIALELAQLGVRHLILVDPDVVEDSNRNRLLLASRHDIGRPKVEVLRRLIRRIDPDVRVTAVPKPVQDPQATGVLKHVDVLFGAIDNHGARVIANQISVRYLIPYIDCGTGITSNNGSIDEAGGQVIVCLPGRFCLDCTGAINAWKAKVDLLAPHLRREWSRAGYIEGENIVAPSVISLNNTIASLAVTELLSLLTGFRRNSSIIRYDALRAEAEEISFEGRQDCPACGPGQLTALGDIEDMEAKAKDFPVPALLGESRQVEE